MGKFTIERRPARDAPCGVLSKAYIENKGVNLAPQVKQRVFDGRETLAKLLIINGLIKFAKL